MVDSSVRLARSLVLASGNAGKLRELSAMLAPLDWQVRPQSDWRVPEAIEDGLTFVENALKKARNAAKFTKLPALGDDSGLIVFALGGAPGIRSARYAGDSASDSDNNQKLLAALNGFSPGERAAEFYCAMALVRSVEDPAPVIAVGRWRGKILESQRGLSGFGYDPLFLPEGQTLASAELEPGVKNSLSHRGQALRALVRQLEEDSRAPPDSC